MSQKLTAGLVRKWLDVDNATYNLICGTMEKELDRLGLLGRSINNRSKKALVLDLLPCVRGKHSKAFRKLSEKEAKSCVIFIAQRSSANYRRQVELQRRRRRSTTGEPSPDTPAGCKTGLSNDGVSSSSGSSLEQASSSAEHKAVIIRRDGDSKGATICRLQDLSSLADSSSPQCLIDSVHFNTLSEILRHELSFEVTYEMICYRHADNLDIPVEGDRALKAALEDMCYRRGSCTLIIVRRNHSERL